MKNRLNREIIAMRVAKELQDGDVVNLGIGIPSLCSQFIPEGKTVIYHSESGVLNYGPMAEEGFEDQDLINASGQFLAPVDGMSFFSSSDAFAMIRGGHIDLSILGKLDKQFIIKDCNKSFSSLTSKLGDCQPPLFEIFTPSGFLFLN